MASSTPDGSLDRSKLAELTLDHARDTVFWLNADACVVHCNAAASRLLGYSRAELLAMRVHDVDIGLRPDAWPDHWAELKRRGQLIFDSRFRTRDGRAIPVEIAVNLLSTGTDELACAFARDLRSRQRHARALHESEERYRAVAESVISGIGITDEEENIVYVNPAFAEMLGYAVDQMVSLNLSDIASPEEYARFEAETVKRKVGGASHYEARLLTKNGESVDVLVGASPLRSTEGDFDGTLAVVVDISDRKRAEEALADAKQAAERESARLSAMISEMEEGVVFADANDRVVEVNEFICTFVGLPRERLVGAHLDELHDSDVMLRVRKVLDGFRADPRSRSLMIQRPIGDAEVMLRVQPIYHGDRYDGALLNVIDVTELVHARREADMVNAQLAEAIERAEESTRQAERASVAKGEFLANMSHEIRTPMNGVLGMTSLLLDTELTAAQREFTEVIRVSSDSLLIIINDILDLSKIEAGKLELDSHQFDLARTVQETVTSLALGAQKKGLECICRVAPDLPPELLGDAGRLRQILLNLVNNAIKFTERGEIVVQAEMQRRDAARVVIGFSVRDSGIGVAADRQAAIFDSFTQADSSTTRRFGGTGLGLAISKHLVELMDGEMRVESTEGEGTTFSFTAAFDLVPGAAVVSSPPPDALRERRILIAESNATNRGWIASLLDGWGCRHDEAADGATALDRLREAAVTGDPFQSAILCLGLFDGADHALGVAIKADPAIAAIELVMMTTYGDRTDAGALADVGADRVVRKPVHARRLLDALLGEESSGPGRAETGDQRFIDRHGTAAEERSRYRILVAEDNPVNRQVALKILDRLGYTADAAVDGRDAIEALVAGEYDLVLMDCQMPEMDGYDATRAIRSGQSGVPDPDIPIIAMTASALDGDRKRCLVAGMDDFVAKPATREQLEAVLSKWLEPRNRPRRKCSSPSIGIPESESGR